MKTEPKYDLSHTTPLPERTESKYKDTTFLRFVDDKEIYVELATRQMVSYVVYNDVKVVVGLTPYEEQAKRISEEIGGFYEISQFYPMTR